VERCWGGAERKGGNRIPEVDMERLWQCRLREHDRVKQPLKENAGENAGMWNQTWVSLSYCNKRVEKSHLS